jgi:hypothetical protein
MTKRITRPYMYCLYRKYFIICRRNQFISMQRNLSSVTKFVILKFIITEFIHNIVYTSHLLYVTKFIRYKIYNYKFCMPQNLSFHSFYVAKFITNPSILYK